MISLLGLAAGCGSGGFAGTSGAGGSGGGSGDDASDDAATTTDGGGQTVVLTLGSADDTPITGITSLDVTITEDGSTRMVPFAHDPQVPIDGQGLVTLSLGIPASLSGMVIFVVDARNAAGCKVATRLITVTLSPAATVRADVSLLRLGDCPATDGGAADAAGPGPGAFAGCDPASPDCPDQMLCEVRCATREAVCTASGDAPHGSVCASDADCAPGTQCIDYGASGCAVKVCRHFCAEDVNCPQPLQANIGKNTCTLPFSCSDVAPPYHTCTLACDPTAGAQANGTTTCPAGLACLLLASDNADCACPPKTQIKAEGATCAGATDCAPGLACHLEGASQVCRPLCRCYADAMTCRAPTDDCPMKTHCTPFGDGIVYGVCVAD